MVTQYCLRYFHVRPARDYYAAAQYFLFRERYSRGSCLVLIFVCMPVAVRIYFYLSVCLTICLSVCMYVYLSVCLSVWLSPCMPLVRKNLASGVIHRISNSFHPASIHWFRLFLQHKPAPKPLVSNRFHCLLSPASSTKWLIDVLLDWLMEGLATAAAKFSSLREISRDLVCRV